VIRWGSKLSDSRDSDLMLGHALVRVKGSQGEWKRRILLAMSNTYT
jgi:hypothetical protein